MNSLPCFLVDAITLYMICYHGTGCYDGTLRANSEAIDVYELIVKKTKINFRSLEC